eukprot:CAMPEP_0202880392 /NCGR_PEP_ID=MMETSP1391-20130828/35044_1 /ASSEMBLY_ACC=CAM_ASM_000867 /TAXON_ID=1034604 /ORGANISM="Chlamydomonas leiostraca, Strain SAG 11-49" /LENGTH=182 /DNA_ID=CAMNT_0049562899 /DNA_START=60 /DNA_END=605 /DNA_ORIENTATION=+
MSDEETRKAEMLKHLEDALNKVKQAEDAESQALALSLMPLDDMRAAAHLMVALNPGPGPGTLACDDYLIRELATWFKTRFFSWVDAPPCGFCGANNPRGGAHMGTPTPEERSHGAGRVEVYTCSVCDQQTRFPRFNSQRKLLESRRGRCGEWANAFLLCCRAAGLDARYVYDVTDHVWVEYW